MPMDLRDRIGAGLKEAMREKDANAAVRRHCA